METELTICDNCEKMVIEVKPGKWFNDVREATEEDLKNLEIGDHMCDRCYEDVYPGEN